MNLKHTILALALLCLTQINAQIVTDRPDQTESSSTVGAGNLQIETGVLIGFDGEDENTNRQILAPTTLFRYGISNTFELRVLNQFESLKNNNISVQGISDLEIGTKIQLLQDDTKNTEIAFLSHLIVPTGTKTLNNTAYGTINKLSISHQINERIGIGYNLGYNYFGHDEGDFTYSVALGITITNKVGIYVEPYGEYVNFKDYVSNFDAGLTYLANPNLQFDFSFGTGINQTMNYVSVGLSWLILKSK